MSESLDLLLSPVTSLASYGSDYSSVLDTAKYKARTINDQSSKLPLNSGSQTGLVDRGSEE